MSEPLKGKIIEALDGSPPVGETYNCIRVEDVQSAVEWLKQKISSHTFSSGYDEQLVLEFIDDAFEDVVCEFRSIAATDGCPEWRGIRTINKTN